MSRRPATSRAKALGFGPVGQGPVEQQLPHVLQRPVGGQLDGRVLPVVEEALLAPDVAHRGLGHHDAFEPPGHVGAHFVGRTDLGHGQQVPDGHHADQLAPVDHR